MSYTPSKILELEGFRKRVPVEMLGFNANLGETDPRLALGWVFEGLNIELERMLFHHEFLAHFQFVNWLSLVREILVEEYCSEGIEGYRRSLDMCRPIVEGQAIARFFREHPDIGKKAFEFETDETTKRVAILLISWSNTHASEMYVNRADIGSEVTALELLYLAGWDFQEIINLVFDIIPEFSEDQKINLGDIDDETIIDQITERFRVQPGAWPPRPLLLPHASKLDSALFAEIIFILDMAYRIVHEKNKELAFSQLFCKLIAAERRYFVAYPSFMVTPLSPFTNIRYIPHKQRSGKSYQKAKSVREFHCYKDLGSLWRRLMYDIREKLSTTVSLTSDDTAISFYSVKVIVKELSDITKNYQLCEKAESKQSDSNPWQMLEVLADGWQGGSWRDTYRRAIDFLSENDVYGLHDNMLEILPEWHYSVKSDKMVVDSATRAVTEFEEVIEGTLKNTYSQTNYKSKVERTIFEAFFDKGRASSKNTAPA